MVLQERGPLPGSESRLLSNIWKWIVRGDTCADKASYFTGKGTWVESSRIRESRRTVLPHGCSLGFYGEGISFWVVFSQSFWLSVLAACLIQPRGMPERILGGSLTYHVSFWSFPNSSGWWWLTSSPFLTRTSCCKTTHANGYYGAWPGRKVSVSMLPLRMVGKKIQIWMINKIQ